MVDEPLALCHHAQAAKAEAIRHPLAAHIVLGRLNPDVRQPKIEKCLIEQGAHTARHETLSLEGRAEPVADVRMPLRPADRVIADDAGQVRGLPDAELGAQARRLLDHGLADELGGGRKAGL